MLDNTNLKYATCMCKMFHFPSVTKSFGCSNFDVCYLFQPCKASSSHRNEKTVIIIKVKNEVLYWFLQLFNMKIVINFVVSV